jgi:hypothetical protein
MRMLDEGRSGARCDWYWSSEGLNTGDVCAHIYPAVILINLPDKYPECHGDESGMHEI